MSRTITLIIGVAVAALTIGAPVASGDAWFADRQSQQDFWNYDQTGKKIANTSPGVTSQDLAGMYSASDVGVTPGRSVKLDAYPASSVLIAKALENPVSVPGNDEPPPVSASNGREIEWPEVGIGLGIGVLLMIGLYLALKGTRQRPLAH